ncbi:Polyketide synthase, phosphopantetheine-binding domain [Fusarium oxysporum f. sp. vasinfectum]|nr:Polyketide synthase, phosphopantetheine-binding domain [Fusarium oxysporum f. sp. vasinfectum]
MAHTDAMQDILHLELANALHISTEELNLDQSFLVQGGDSLSAVQFLSKCRLRGIHIDIVDTVQCKTLAELVERIISKHESNPHNLILNDRVGNSDTSTSSSSSDDAASATGSDSTDTVPDVRLKHLAQDPARQIESIGPCSSMQNRILISQAVNPAAYQCRFILRIKSSVPDSLTASHIANAWPRIVARHSSLRTTFLESETRQSTFDQVVWTEVNPKVTILQDEAQVKADGMLNSFESGSVPHHMYIYAASSSELILRLEVSHAVIDGRSADVLLYDLCAAYENQLPDTKAMPYTDFVRMEEESFQDVERIAGYWQNYLRDAEETYLAGVGNKPRAGLHTLQDRVDIPAEEARRFCDAYGVTLVSVCQVAWSIVLRLFAMKDDVTFSYVNSGRQTDLPGIDGAIGLFISSLLLRVKFKDDPTVLDMLKTVTDDVFRGMAHDKVPLMAKGAKLPTSHKWGNSILSFRKEWKPKSTGHKELEMSFLRGVSPTDYDHSINVEIGEGGIAVDYDIWTSTTNQADAAKMLNCFLEAIRFIIANPSAKVNSFDGISSKDAQHLRDVNGEGRQPVASCIHTLVQEVTDRQPDAMAVYAWDGTMTYRELDTAASSLAEHLMKLNIGPEVMVGICMDKSRWAAVSMLAVLKSGGIVLPLGADQPLSRLQTILSDTKAPIILVDNAQLNRLKDLGPQQLIEVNEALFQTLPSASCSACTTVSTDNAAWSFISSAHVDFLSLTSTVAGLLDPSQLPFIKTVILMGEPVKPAVLDLWKDQASVLESYAPSECSIYATVSPPTDEAHLSGLSPGELLIEGPLLARGYLNDEVKTNKSFIVDPEFVAKYDLGRNRRMYRTGDLVRQNDDGSYTTLGRQDTQIKIRGQRVEVDEIEYHITRHPSCIQAVVLYVHGQLVAAFSLPSDGAAYSGAALDGENAVDKPAAMLVASEVQLYLSQYVPDYMIPRLWIPMASLPINSSGKADRRRISEWIKNLDLSSYSDLEHQVEDGLQVTSTERQLREIWSSVLNKPINHISYRRSFLSLGGDSITAMQVVSACRKQGLIVTVRQILQSPAISELALRVKEASDKMGDEQLPIEIPDEPFDLSPAQKMFFQDIAPSGLRADGPHRFNQSVCFRIPQNVAANTVARAIEAIVTKHAMLRARFQADQDSSQGWQQRVEKQIMGSYRFQTHKVGDDAATEDIIRHSQGSLDLEYGPVFAVDIFEMEDGQLINLTAHHLVIDLMSWRILAADLEHFLRFETLQPSLSLPFPTWSKALMIQAKTVAAPEDTVADTWSYWSLEPGSFVREDQIVETLAIDHDTSARLLGPANEPLQTGVTDILLAALHQSFADVFTDRSAPTIHVEGHGRDAGGDVSETVGWFTTVTPLKASNTSNTGFISILQQVKDFRKLNADNTTIEFAAKYKPSSTAGTFPQNLIEILFNYHGQFQQLDRADGLLSIHKLHSSETSIGDKVRQQAAITIEVSVDAGCVTISVGFSRRTPKGDDVRRWLQRYGEVITSAVSELMYTERTATASDYPLSHLSSTDLVALKKHILEPTNISWDAVVDILPCSSTQQGIFISQLKSPTTYRLRQTCRVIPTDSPSVDVKRLGHAWRQVVSNHSIMRTIFTMIPFNDRFYQVVLKSVEPDIRFITCSSETEVQECIASHALMEDHLGQPSHRFLVISTEDGHVYGHFEISHALVDASSVQLLVNTLLQAYEGATNISGSDYGTYISFLEQGSEEDDLRYWEKRLATVEPCQLQLGEDLTASEEDTGHSVSTAMQEMTTLQKLCQSNDITPANVLQLAWALVLSSRTQLDEVCFGYLSSGRDIPIDGADTLVGPMINMIVCNIALDYSQSCIDAMKDIQDRFLDSFEHQRVSLATIQHSLSSSQQSLFNTTVSYVRAPNLSGGARSIQSIRLERIAADESTEYDFNLSMLETESGIDIALQYLPGAASTKTAQRLLNHLKHVVQVLSTSETTSLLGDLDLVPAEDKQTITAINREAPKSLDSCVHLLVQEMTNRQPNALAFQAWDGSLTYRELDLAASTLAKHLMTNLNVGPEVMVGICMDKSIWAAMSMLAVLKAGGVVLPLGVQQPLFRLQTILKDTQASVILVDAKQKARLAGVDSELIEVNHQFMDGLSTGRRMYRAGDLVRQNDDGTYSNLGRRDQQIKIRGKRVEVGEIEYHISRHSSGIRACVVFTTSGSSDGQLVTAFSVPRDDKAAHDETAYNGIAGRDGIDTTAALLLASEIQMYLSQHIPDYMIPRLWIPMTTLPINSSGKADRRAVTEWINSLSPTELASYSELESAAEEASLNVTPTEQKLREIWSSVLNVPNVSYRRSFMSLGGDSITAMQVVSACREIGLVVTVRDILQSPAISDLATRVKASDGEVFSAEIPDGPFELSPAQKMFFEDIAPAGLKSEGSFRFNQSVCFRLQSEGCISEESVAKAIEAVVTKHAMLRSRFVSQDQGYQQWIEKQVPGSYRFKSHNADDDTAVQAIMLESQSTLDLEHGPVFAAEFIQTPDRQLLFLTAHHLVIDLMSWRIIAKDLEQIIQSGSMVTSQSLPFPTWSNAVLQQAQSIDSVTEADTAASWSYWGLQPGEYITEDQIFETVKLDEQVTSQLLGPANEPLRSGVADILLAALSTSFRRSFADRAGPSIFIEGHGRDTQALDINYDLSDTVGWFTTVTPLNISDNATFISTLLQVKDLRKLNSGREVLDFAAQRSRPIEVLFNYHGQFQQLQRSDGLLTLDKLHQSVGQLDASVGGKVRQHAALSVEVSIDDAGKTHLMVGYPRHSPKSQAIRDWLGGGVRELVISEPMCTISDFPLAQLTNDDLETLYQYCLTPGSISWANVENVLPCSPIQQGILLSQLRAPSRYRLKQTCRILPADPSSPLDIARLANAWRQVVEQHSIMRTIFTGALSHHDRFYQVVLKALEADIQIIEPCSSDEEVQRFIKHHALLHDPVGRPSHRFLIIPTVDGHVFGHFEISHALVDASSVQLLVNDLLEAYESLSPTKTSISLSRNSDYGSYVSFLEQHRHSEQEDLQYWKDLLETAEPCHLQLGQQQHDTSEMETDHAVTAHIPDVSVLRDMCRNYNVTAANVAQLAWALVLASRVELNQICFGYLSSGRDIPIDGVERLVGPMINMMICYVQLDYTSTTIDVIRQIQDRFFKGFDHQRASLASIQHSLQGTQQQTLFNTTVSYTRALNMDGATDNNSIKLERASADESTEYDFNLSILENDQSLDLVLQYIPGVASHEVAQRLLNQLKHAIQVLSQHTTATLADLDLVPTEEKHAIVAKNRDVPAPVASTIHALFHEVYERRPDEMAVYAWDGVMTFRELEVAAGNLAGYLMDLGVGPEIMVGICMDKSRWAVVAMLAVLKAGGVVLPMGVQQPLPRVQTIITDTKAPIILVDDKQLERLAETGPRLIKVDAALQNTLKPSTAGLSQADLLEPTIAMRESFEEVRGHLISVLPRYMVPEIFIPMSRLPLNSSGKLDRRAIDLFLKAMKPEELDIYHSRTAEGHDQSSLVPIPAPFSLWPEHGAEKQVGLRAEIAERCGVMAEQIEDVYPCTPLQEGLLLTTIRQPTAYISRRIFSLSDEINVARLQAAWQKMAEAAHVLRTRILLGLTSGSVQVVVNEPLEWHTASSLEEYIDHDSALSMTEGKPLMRFGIIESNNGERLLVWTAHHSVYDGWSLTMMYRQVSNMYWHDATPISAPYTPFIAYLGQADATKAASYWREQLQGNPTAFPALPSMRYQPQPRQKLVQSLDFVRQGKSEHLFVVQPAADSDDASAEFPGLVHIQDMSEQFDDYALTVECSIGSKGISIESRFDDAVISTAQMQRMLQSFAHIASQLEQAESGTDSTRISDIDTLSPQDLDRILSVNSAVEVGEGQVGDGVLAPSETLQKAWEEIRIRLAEVLPQYMIPDFFIPMSKLPVNSSGKLDRRAITAVLEDMDDNKLEEYRLTIGARLVPVTTDMEKQLQQLWSQVLRRPAESIGASDNFFHLNGDSLAAIQLVAAARAVDIKMTVTQIFQSPVLRDLATHLEQVRHSHEIRSHHVEGVDQATQAAIKATLPSHFNVEKVLETTEFQSLVLHEHTQGRWLMHATITYNQKVDKQRVHRALQTTVDKNEVLRTVFTRHDGKSYQAILNNFTVPLQEHIAPTDPSTFCKSLVQEDQKKHLELHEPPFKTWFVQGEHKDSLVMSYYIDALRAIDTKPAMKFWGDLLQGSSMARLPGASQTSKAMTGSYIVKTVLSPKVEGSGLTVSSYLKAAWAMVLAKATGTSDVVFAHLVSGRSLPIDDIEKVNGPCVNLIPIRVNTAQPQSTILQQVHQQHISALPHEHLGWETIFRQCTNWNTPTDQIPRFSSILQYQNLPEAQKSFGMHGAECSVDYTVVPPNVTDVWVTVEPKGGEISIVAGYSEEVIASEVVEGLMEDLCEVLKGIEA